MNPLHNTEIAVSITREEALVQLISLSSKPTLADCLDLFNWSNFPTHLYAIDSQVTRIYFGGEFCDRLLPDKKTMQRVLALISKHKLQLSLLTPLVSDQALSRLKQLFAILPNGCEVIVNDWGTLSLLRRDYTHIVPVIGRQLCKMIKDPRLPSAQWTKLYPHGVQSGPFHQLLERFEINRLEMDVPPFAEVHDFDTPEKALSVHLPFGFSVKGRMCKIGAMGIDKPRKFGPGHGCNKECLQYSSKVSRTCSPATNKNIADSHDVEVQGNNKVQDLITFQQGNTMFYRHSAAMTETLAQAISLNRVNRMIFEGDWHEDYRTD